MYRYKKPKTTNLAVDKSYPGETIEQKINRIVNNGEPISDGAPLIYTERKDGVLPQHDIRTDRFEIAVEKMDYVTRSNIAKREARIVEMNKKKEDGEPKPTQGTADPGTNK